MVLKRLQGVEQDLMMENADKYYSDEDDNPVDIAQQRVMAAVQKGAPKQHEVEQWHRFTGLGIGLASLLTDNVLSHPCIVLRRQCQVNQRSVRYHLTPFSVFQVMINLQRAQGLSTLWKGISSKFVVQGICLCSDAFISEVTWFPKEINRHSKPKQVIGHIAMKGITLVVSMPFFSASLIETVQSDIASEKPGVLDCVKEGFSRLLGWGMPQTRRLLPMWTLVVPTVLHGLLHYILSSVVQQIALFILNHRYQKRVAGLPRDEQPPPKTMVEAYYPQLFASFLSHLVTDIVLYPLETVLHRLHIQGTRTIIDNTDFGTEVVPIDTRYEGLQDCFESIQSQEGRLGFFKGFGALILQYALHLAILKITNVIFIRISEDFGYKQQR
ncbi:mitochondrial outer membrane protein SLC25A46-like [Ptychodera flava]|uniref:mitochondrial outer membrane protein SLC25A46-like n=1 Tax=Ptychodera flava TaxID=63121 RepID=UPI00396A7AB0